MQEGPRPLLQRVAVELARSDAHDTLERVHERPYHLFVISQDMAHFQHIHPEQRPDMTWAIDVMLPKPGYYTVLSDFLPSGGASQLISRPLVTAGTGLIVAIAAAAAGLRSRAITGVGSTVTTRVVRA